MPLRLCWTASALRTYQGWSEDSPWRRAFERIIERIERGEVGRKPGDLNLPVDARLPNSASVYWEPVLELSNGAPAGTCLVVFTKAVPESEDAAGTILALYEGPLGG